MIRIRVLAKMSFNEIFDLTAGGGYLYLYWYFNLIFYILFNIIYSLIVLASALSTYNNTINSHTSNIMLFFLQPF